MHTLAALPAVWAPRAARASHMLRIRASPIVTLKLAAVAACHTAFAQPAFDPVVYDEQQRQIVEQIHAVQSRGGVHSAGLIAPLTELALLYEEGEDHVLAIAAIERALQVIRVNHGIHSLQQAPLLRQAIRNEEARGDPAAAWDREQQLLELARRHPEDPRTVPIFREVADRRMTLFEQWTAGEYPQQMILGDYCEAFGQIFTCSRRLAARQVLADAQAHYADAIAVILRNELYSSEALRALEMELIRTSDLPRARPELVNRRSAAGGRRAAMLRRTVGVEERERDPVAISLGRNPVTARLGELSPRLSADEQGDADESSTESVRARTYYAFGRRSLRRIYEYEVASSAPLLNQLEAFVRIADWDLLYSRNSRALGGYEQVYSWLEGTPDTQPWIEELFSPGTPVVLPAFAPSPLASEHSEDSGSYIDVAFRITRYGQPRRIRILDTTTHVAETATKCLVQLIRSSRFRPRVVDGEFRTSPVVVRYYLNYGPSDGAGDGAASDSTSCRVQLRNE